MNKYKDIIIIGFAFFSIFFGASNLIFPPYIGVTSGSEWLTSLLGFVIGDVGLILVSIYAILKLGSLNSVLSRAGSKFGTGLEILIMICLGPALVIPRTAATTFEMSIQPHLSGFNPIIFSIIYFIINILFSIRPSKVIDIIGKVLTPILLVCLSVLIIKGIISPIGDINTNIKAQDLFVSGLTQGYQTMDPLGTGGVTAFVVATVLGMGYTCKKEIMSLTMKGAIVSGIALTLIYAGLTYIGVGASSVYDSSMSQTAILSGIINNILGNGGSILLSIVVALACITTSIGLTSVTAKYFSELSGGKIKYEHIVIGISILSSITANFGVSIILSISVPVLTIIYPIMIVLVVMSCFDKVFVKNQVYKGAAMSTLFISVLTAIDSLGVNIPFINSLPLANLGLSWIIFAVIGGVIGKILSLKDLSLDEVI